MSILASTKRTLSDHWPEPVESEADNQPLFDDEHFELVDGQLVEKSMGVEEQFIDSDFYFLLTTYVRQQGLGRTVMECKFALPNSKNRRIPDLAFISYETWPKSNPRPKGAFWRIAPDLAVEVISPTDGGRDIAKKTREYFNAGVKSVWVVWPELEEIHVHDSKKSVKIYGIDDVLEGDPVIPGFRMPIVDLFPPEEQEADETES